MKITIVIQEDNSKVTEVTLCAPGKSGGIKAMLLQSALAETAQDMLNEIVETAELDGVDEADAINLIPVRRLAKQTYSITNQ